ncbi:hypothetical protein BU16DRAFT_260730 [Lophium mytilinum]|uniref:Uncharacterized protein n=1 Tax=Lophium mytilinum TaxID=390894 RepID=A0A6A6R2L7_9PEZI|nr:hypothetical protein BU16DRAFT_260730 [Lophium mytilinum]
MLGPSASSSEPHSGDSPRAPPPTSISTLNALSAAANSVFDVSSAMPGERDPTSPLFSGRFGFLDNPLSSASLATLLETVSSPLPEVTVYWLLHPPSSAFRGGILSLNWAVMVAGWSHFELRNPDERPILKADSVLRIRGKELGMPEAYFNWLCGDDVRYTETEDGFMLTPEFFYGDEEFWQEEPTVEGAFKVVL